LKCLGRAPSNGLPPNIGHSGSGTVSHLVGELFSERTKIKFNPVSYRGSAPALIDVAAGVAAAHFATLASGAPLLAAGKIRALAVAGSRRMDTASMKNVPTFAELAYKDMVVNQWWALVAPATTPIETLEYLRLNCLGAMGSPKVLERLSTLGVDLKGSTRDELRGFMRSESSRWQAVAQQVGLKPQ
jgi:tripartite-type tricarboxylate transporter receptor subunit TctC